MAPQEGIQLDLGCFAVLNRDGEEFECHFLDAAEVCEASETDGVHLDQDAHLRLALAVAGKLEK